MIHNGKNLLIIIINGGKKNFMKSDISNIQWDLMMCILYQSQCDLLNGYVIIIKLHEQKSTH